MTKKCEIAILFHFKVVNKNSDGLLFVTADIPEGFVMPTQVPPDFVDSVEPAQINSPLARRVDSPVKTLNGPNKFVKFILCVSKKLLFIEW